MPQCLYKTWACAENLFSFEQSRMSVHTRYVPIWSAFTKHGWPLSLGDFLEDKLHDLNMIGCISHMTSGKLFQENTVYLLPTFSKYLSQSWGYLWIHAFSFEAATIAGAKPFKATRAEEMYNIGHTVSLLLQTVKEEGYPQIMSLWVWRVSQWVHLLQKYKYPSLSSPLKIWGSRTEINEPTAGHRYINIPNCSP